MKRTVLVVIGVILTVAGLAAFGLAVAYFIQHDDPYTVSRLEIGQILPWYTAPGVLSAALGIILLTFRNHY